LSEWVGSDPAVLERSFVNFNGDIPGGVFSYLDLYLMGYVTPEEMDKGVSELRYMDQASCGVLEQYDGRVSNFGSDDIISVAGPRFPDRFGATHHFRTAWIMVHLPGQEPTEAQVDKALGMLEQQGRDWNTSTLGRGTMDHRLGRPVATIAHGEPTPGELRVYGTENSTVFGYTVHTTTAVSLVVHDAAGRRITELVQGVQNPGNYIVSWDGGPDSMAPVEAGSYFLRLEIGPEVSTSPIVLVD